MAKLRDWLNELNFDWETGQIIFQDIEENAYCPGWASECDLKNSVLISKDHPILDKEFYSGYGAPECPRFFAKDSKAIYFPVQYDGSTGIEKIIIDVAEYVGSSKPTPYPGG